MSGEPLAGVEFASLLSRDCARPPAPAASPAEARPSAECSRDRGPVPEPDCACESPVAFAAAAAGASFVSLSTDCRRRDGRGVCDTVAPVEALVEMLLLVVVLAAAAVTVAVVDGGAATIGLLGARNEPEVASGEDAAAALEAGEPESRRERLLDGRRFGVEGSSRGTTLAESPAELTPSAAARRLPAVRRTGFPSAFKLVVSSQRYDIRSCFIQIRNSLSTLLVYIFNNFCSFY